MSRADLASALAAGPVLLDGGLATELEAAGHDLSGTLWSGRLLLESPEAVTAAHARFFAAGARVATTASYQLSYDGLAAVGVDGARGGRAAAAQRGGRGHGSGVRGGPGAVLGGRVRRTVRGGAGRRLGVPG